MRLSWIKEKGRNILTARGIFNLDFSLVKDTRLRFLGEGGKLEFRSEFFNIFNHANLGRPGLVGSTNQVFAGTADVQPPLANVGRIVQTNTKSRQIQFALKIIF